MEKAGQLSLKDDYPKFYDYLYHSWNSVFEDGGQAKPGAERRREKIEKMHLMVRGQCSVVFTYTYA